MRRSRRIDLSGRSSSSFGPVSNSQYVSAPPAPNVKRRSHRRSSRMSTNYAGLPMKTITRAGSANKLHQPRTNSHSRSEDGNRTLIYILVAVVAFLCCAGVIAAVVFAVIVPAMQESSEMANSGNAVELDSSSSTSAPAIVTTSASAVVTGALTSEPASGPTNPTNPPSSVSSVTTTTTLATTTTTAPVPTPFTVFTVGVVGGDDNNSGNDDISGDDNVGDDDGAVSAAAFVPGEPRQDGSCANVDMNAQTFPEITWQKIYFPGRRDAKMKLYGGTEARSLVAFQGKLFAGIGYWTDKQYRNASLPGAQVMRMNRAGGPWIVDFEAKERVTPSSSQRRFHTISVLTPIEWGTRANGTAIADGPVPLLLAAVWQKRTALTIFTRDASTSGNWQRSKIISLEQGATMADCRMHVRSFVLYRDSVTGEDVLLAGTNGRAACRTAIWRGRYCPNQPGRICWLGKEKWLNAANRPAADDRVSSFAVANGILHAAICDSIYRRVDGEDAKWRRVFQVENGIGCPAGPGEWGWRGLTAVPPPSGNSNVQHLIAGMEGNTSRVTRWDPANGYSATLELDAIARLKAQWGGYVGYTILSYNRMPQLTGPDGCYPVRLIGFEARIGPLSVGHMGHRAQAWYFLRHPNGTTYGLRRLHDPALMTQPPLVATRTFQASPFPSERFTTVYAGGFDCNHNENRYHNTAWIYKGTMST